MEWKEAFEKGKIKGSKLIYRLCCNEINYIGIMSACRRKSIQNHYSALKKGIHPNQELQNSWNESQEIKNEPLEIVNDANADERLKYWQSLYKCNGKAANSKVFYQLNTRCLRQLKQAGAISNQALIFFILKLKNPWCDRPIVVKPLQIAVEWDLPESSVYEAILKLKKQGIIQITDSTMSIQWVRSEWDSDIPETLNSRPFENSDISERSNSHASVHSEKQDTILKNQNRTWNFRNVSEFSENETPEPLPNKDSEVSHTSLDLKKTYSECKTRANAHTRGNPKSTQRTTQESTVGNRSLSTSTIVQENPDEDKFFPPAPASRQSAQNATNDQLPSKYAETVLYPQKLGFEEVNVRPQVRRAKFLYPDGEWLDERGRMNADFIRWMASRWKTKFSDNSERPIEEIMADVLSYFANQPEKVAIQWDAYCAIAHRKVENITQRALTGFAMSSEDAKQYAIAAAAVPTNQADAAVDFTPQSVCDRAPEVQQVLPAVPVRQLQAQTDAIADPWEFPSPISTQEIKTLAPIDITPEEQVANCQKLAAMINGLVGKKMPAATRGKTWAIDLSIKSKEAQKLLVKPQYQINKYGYFIDEEGEW